MAVDWHIKSVIEGKVGADVVLTIPSDKPIFSIELSH